MRISLVIVAMVAGLLIAGCQTLLGIPDTEVDNEVADGGETPMDGGPDPDAGPPGPVAIAAGNQHTCTVFSDGRVFCWGANNRSQLGIGNTGGNRAVATQVPGITDAMTLAAGGDHTCVVSTNGAVSCWGHNASGQIGIGDATQLQVDSPTSVNVPPATQITAGQCTCIRLMDGQARCWGSNTAGLLGIGVADNIFPSPQDVMLPAGTTLREIHVGLLHACALDSNGNVLCWGSNTSGELTGTGDSTVPRSTGISGVATLWAGERHNCVTLQNNGEVQCWGSNTVSQLGYDTGSLSSNTAMAVPGFTNATAADAGNHNCAIVGDDLFCWGHNLQGQLGFDPATATETLTPTQVDLGGSKVTAVAAGAQHTCAILADTTIMCWGRDAAGQLGDGMVTNGNRFTPMPVVFE